MNRKFLSVLTLSLLMAIGMISTSCTYEEKSIANQEWTEISREECQYGDVLDGPSFAVNRNGSVISAEKNWTNDGAIVTGYVASGSDPAESDVIIPSTYNFSGTVLPVVMIGIKAFVYANLDSVEITSITIPDSVTEIKDHAFMALDKLTAVTFGGTPALTTIGRSAFAYCYSLTSITIPSGVEIIPEDCFYHCEGLTNVSFASPSIVRMIDKQAFAYCFGLTTFTLPSSMKTLLKRSFGNCRSLTTMVLNEGLTRIGDEAFIGDTNLTTIDFPSTIEDVGVTIFRDCNFTYDTNTANDGINYHDNWAISLYDKSELSYSIREGTIGVARDLLAIMPNVQNSSTSSGIRVSIPSTLKYASGNFLRQSGNYKNNSKATTYTSLDDGTANRYITIAAGNQNFMILTINGTTQQHLLNMYQDSAGEYQTKFVMGTYASVWTSSSVFPNSYSYQGLTSYTVIGTHSSLGVPNFLREQYASKSIAYNKNTNTGSGNNARVSVATSESTKTTTATANSSWTIILNSTVRKVDDFAFELRGRTFGRIYYLVIPMTVEYLGDDLVGASVYFEESQPKDIFYFLEAEYDTYAIDEYNPLFPSSTTSSPLCYVSNQILWSCVLP